MNRYEAMFLFDSATTRAWSDVMAEISRLMGRISAELLVCVKYDDRKLAFEVKGRKRGTYVLAYFNAAPETITALERDVRLSETVLRVLVLRADKVTDERIEELKKHPAEEPLQPLGSGDGRRGDDRDRDRDRPHHRRGDGPRDRDDSDRDDGDDDYRGRPRRQPRVEASETSDDVATTAD